MDSSLVTDRTAANLRVDDFICQRCNVQATNAADSICESCKAIGKRSVRADYENGLWSDMRFGGVCARRFILGLRA